EQLESTINTRIQTALEGGQLSGVRVFRQSNPITGETFIVVELPGDPAQTSSLSEIIQTQGRFEIRVETTGNNTS
ncbi:MAG: hypothetical protein SV377_08075, partial [Halobacteria archaeon]|nr:hypothetical protein [Halobacteria archaeon]